MRHTFSHPIGWGMMGLLLLLAQGCGLMAHPSSPTISPRPASRSTPHPPRSVIAKPVAMTWSGPNTGWIVSMARQAKQVTIVRTTNGGRSWVFQTPAAFCTSAAWERITALSATTAWVWCDPGGPALVQDTKAIWQTSNGGATWQRRMRTATPEPSASHTIPLSGSLTNLVFLSPHQGWALVTPFGAANHVRGGTMVSLWQTSDGGRQWVARALPTGLHLYGPLHAAMAWTNIQSGRLWVLGHALRANRAPFVLLALSTTDGGRQWSVQRLTPPLDPAHAVFSASASDGLWVLTAHHLWVYRRHRWQDVGTPPNVAIQRFEMVSATQGWILGAQTTGHSRSLWQTTNGGQTWHRKSLPTSM